MVWRCAWSREGVVVQRSPYPRGPCQPTSEERSSCRYTFAEASTKLVIDGVVRVLSA